MTFNHAYLLEDNFRDLIVKNPKHFDRKVGDSTMKIVDNVKRINKVMKGWAKNLASNSYKELKEVDERINFPFLSQ